MVLISAPPPFPYGFCALPYPHMVAVVASTLALVFIVAVIGAPPCRRTILTEYADHLLTLSMVSGFNGEKPQGEYAGLAVLNTAQGGRAG